MALRLSLLLNSIICQGFRFQFLHLFYWGSLGMLPFQKLIFTFCHPKYYIKKNIKPNIYLLSQDEQNYQIIYQQLNYIHSSLPITEIINIFVCLINKKMKGSTAKRGIFVEIGRKLATSKPISKRQSLSFASSNIATATAAPQINQTQPLLPCKRKMSQPCSSVNKTYAAVSNINDDFLFMRKENYLNTKFLIRKNKLKEITKENKQLHDRINSQKSLYSSSDLNKSFQSNNEIKKRLSQSKLSQRLNSSRSSSRSKIDSSKGNRFEKKKEIRIAIKAASIHSTEGNDLQSFKALFRNQISSVKNQPRKQQQSVSFKSYRQNDTYKVPPKMPIRKSIDTYKQSTDTYNEGALLHRIAEQMIDNVGKINGKKRPNYQKNTKMFHF